MGLWDWLKGHPLEDAWREWMRANQAMDQQAQELIPPDFYQVVKDGNATYHLCGFAKLCELSQHDWMFKGGVTGHPEYFVLAGPLPNGRFYIPPGNVGHEPTHRIYELLGLPSLEADHMCEGV